MDVVRGDSWSNRSAGRDFLRLIRTHPIAHTPATGPHSPAHVRVVVRTHEKELLELRSLIYSLRGQAQRQGWLTLDFVLVPTEPGAQATYRALREGAGSNRDHPNLANRLIVGLVGGSVGGFKPADRCMDLFSSVRCC